MTYGKFKALLNLAVEQGITLTSAADFKKFARNYN